ncbi:DUF2188 domain-containing protein [Corallococcus sp. bb12-1]|uniref:DUF2188 domain-containing protein n=1 Tax=Corallococcus sp. bb12-1 TaxID=2996784 RepID=UPI00226D9EF3|nr:DUF2188 domain-containing protein [Corallococcus sp. bb12-1]MCY1044649.1 DUF2188 domain-containing protein [Corallococcus sp. bb12-1]
MAENGRGDVHTVPNSGGDGWVNKQNGVSLGQHRTKKEAVQQGAEVARRDKVEHFIHNENGQISERNSYGHDPRSSPG